MTPHPFSLRQLQYALAVADLGGFRAASRACHVSQPSLSAQVAELEGALGVVLFERTRPRVRVTPEGERLLARMRQVLLMATELTEAVTALEDPLARELRIGVIPTVASYVLPAFAPALKRAFPALRALWVEDKTAALVAGIGRGELDAAVLALEANVGALEAEVLARDPFVLAGAPSHPQLRARGRVRRLAHLAGETIHLLEDGHCFRDQARDLCSTVGLREAAFRATSLATLVQVVLGAGGLTLLPALSLAVENRDGQLATRRFAKPEPYRTIALAFRVTTPMAGALRRIAAAMRDAFPKPT